MFASLGYQNQLEQIAQPAKRHIQNHVDVTAVDIKEILTDGVTRPGQYHIDSEPIVGTETLTYVVRRKEGRASYVAQIAPTGGAERLAVRAALTRYLEDQSNIPIPSIVTADTSMESFPFPYVLAEYVDGETFDGPDTLRSMEQERRQSIMRSVGKVLGALHSEFAFEGFGSVKPVSGRRVAVDQPMNDWSEYYTSRWEEQYSNANDLDTPVDHLATRAFSFLMDANSYIDHEPKPALCHNDLRFDNVVVTKDRIAGVLDWGVAIVGDPATDIIKTREQFVDIFRTSSRRQPMWESLIDGYNASRPVDLSFLKQLALFDVARFVPIGSYFQALDRVIADFDEDAFVKAAEDEFRNRLEKARGEILS